MSQVVEVKVAILVQEQTGSISNSSNSASDNVNSPFPLGGHDLISCIHGSFSGHRHCSNSHMIDVSSMGATYYTEDCWTS